MRRRLFTTMIPARACRLSVATALAASLITGCGSPKETLPDLVPVSGKLTFRGEPLADATIMFVPADGDEEPTELGRILRPGAKTDAEGAFELFCGDNPGAPPGKYNVAVMAFKPRPEGDETDTEEKSPSLIPEIYGNPKTSGLTRDVKEEGDNVINIDLQ